MNPTEPPREPQPAYLRCSFCNKSQRDVKKLIAGPAVQICDECVDICLDIIAEDRKDAPSEPEANRDPFGNVSYPASSKTLVLISCSLCHMAMPLEHGLPIDSRGLLCPGCIGAVEAAIAAAREPGQQE
jgi:hypothetical protein